MRLTWVCIGLFTVARLVYTQSFLLTPDETNYWQWGRHLAWGYHDQAPMIAWTIRLATLVFGNVEFAVRLPSVVAMTIASVYLVLLSRRWFGAQVAWQTALISQSIFIFNVGGLMATADGLQGAAWVAATYHASRALETGNWRQWLVSGVWFGLGLLSKYTVILFLPCIVAYVVFSPHHRHYLKSIKPYISYGIGGLMFLPVVAWNANNNWNSVRHVAYIGGANEPLGLHFNFFFEFLLSQAGLLTPLIFILIIAAWWKLVRHKSPSGQWIHALLAWTSLPIFLGFSLLNLHSRVYANWACFGYLTPIVLISAIYAPRDAIGGDTAGPFVTAAPRLWYWAMGISYALTIVILLQVILPVIPIPEKWDRIAGETQGWDSLGQHVGRVHQAMPDPQQAFIFGLNYQIASELAFYVPDNPQTVSINRWHRPNVYDYWWQDKDLIGRDAVGCIESQYYKRLSTIFERVELDSKFPITRSRIFSDRQYREKPLKRYFIYRCYGFKGGLNWNPPDPDDIRR